MTITDTWVDPDGVECYKKKAIMEWLVPRIDLNSMWDGYRAGAFPKHEFMQFYCDIGYSVAGFDEVWDWRDEEENLTQEVIKDMTEEKTGQTYTILCPRHLKSEEITLPARYSNEFEGIVPCGANSAESIYICVSFGYVCGIRRGWDF